MGKTIFYFFTFSLALFISACGGGGSSSTSTSSLQNAYLIDAPVEGVEYYCDNDSASSAYTKSNGLFTYTDSCINITFKVGTITIATIQEQNINADKKVFITDLVNTSRNDTNNTAVKNIIRLLQTLDDDLNPENGITISATTRANIQLSSSYFLSSLLNNESDMQDIVTDASFSDNRTLVANIKALVHFEQTLRDNNINIDTVAPYKPYLFKNITSTTNTIVPLKIFGEKNTNIFINGIDDNKTINNTGYLEFDVNTSLSTNTFADFNITLKDSLGKESEVLMLKIFNDTDQPSFNSVSEINTSTIQIVDLNITDSRIAQNLGFDYSIAGDSASIFDVNTSTNILYFKSLPTSSADYNITITATEETNTTHNPHSESKSLLVRFTP